MIENYTSNMLRNAKLKRRKLKEISLILREGVSNLDECIEKAISISSNLPSLWTSANYRVKQKIQFLLFPDGIRYNKKNDKCRTERINSVFAYIACLAQEVTKQKSGIPELNIGYSTLLELCGTKSNFLRDLKALLSAEFCTF